MLALARLFHLILTIITIAYQMTDIGDINNLIDFISRSQKNTLQRICKNIGAEITDMWIVIDGWSAMIHADNRLAEEVFFDRRIELFIFREGIRQQYLPFFGFHRSYSIMCSMNSSKRLPFAVLLVVIMAVSYLFGLNRGYQSYSSDANLASITNRSVSASTTADFASFWKAWNVLSDKFAGTTTTDQERVWGAIQGMTASMGDPYTVFFPPEENEAFQSEIAGNFQGVGMEVGIKDGKLAVVAPIKDAPADKAGVKAGDFIAKIGDKDSLTMSTDAAIKLIRGKAGTPVTLTFIRAGVKAPVVITIIRATIEIPTIKTTTKTETPSGETVAGGDGLRKDGIFVVSLYSFSANSANLFRNALKDFIASGSHKLVIDLRGNPGGYLDAAVDMASWFLPSGKTIVKEELGKSGGERVFRSKGYNIFTDKLRMIILVDGGSASASEILAGALSENGVATLVGAKTFGKGSVQELVPITSETSLKVTIARWLTPNGNSISKLGITPQYVVPFTAEDQKNQTDPQMDKAVELLSKEP